MFGKLLHMVLRNTAQCRIWSSCHVRSAHQAMQDSHVSHCREQVEITRSIIISAGSSVHLPCVWSSVLPQSDNRSKGQGLSIHYPELLSYYRMVCSCESQACPTHFGCSCKYRGIWQILELELHFCVLIIAHSCIYVGNIQMIRKILCEPPLQMTTLSCQRTK